MCMIYMSIVDIFDMKKKSILLKIGAKQNFVSIFRTLYVLQFVFSYFVFNLYIIVCFNHIIYYLAVK